MSNLFAFPKSLNEKRQLVFIRPIFFLPVAFSIGIWLSRFYLPSFFLAALSIFFALIALMFFMRDPLFLILSASVFFSMGVLFGINDHTVSDHDVGLLAPRGTLVLEGVVASVPETVVKGRKETVSFVLEAHDFFRKGFSRQITGKVQVFLYNPGRLLRFGDRLRLRGVLEAPKENRNPYAFDYGNYLAQNGITRIFRGIGKFSVVLQEEGKGNKLFLYLNYLRAFLDGRIKQLFPSPCHELASALVLGFRKNIPRDIQDAFIKTGTAHLIAISGLNISLVGGLFYFLMGFLKLPRMLNLGLTAVFIAVYMILAGTSAPVLRAGIMGIVILVGFLLGQERNLKSAFFFSYFLLLVWNPGTLFTASFQLSFVAMASLIFLLPKFEEIIRLPNSGTKHPLLLYKGKFTRLLNFFLHLRHSLSQTLFSSLAVTIGMFPILIWYFNLFSAIGFIANIVAIPICTVAIASTLILLLLDLFFPSVAHALAFMSLIFYRLELWLIDWLSKFPVGYFYIPKPPWFFFVFYYGFLIAWLFLFRYHKSLWVRRACLTAFSFSIGIFLVGASPPHSSFTFFDLGKTDAAFISFSNGANCLINTGNHFPSDQAYWILRPFLMGSGIHKLDSVLLTKMDARHVGGFRTLVQHVKIQKVLVQSGAQGTSAWSKYLSSERYQKWRLHQVLEGDQIRFGSGSTYIHVLAVSQKEILALEITDGRDKILYITSANKEVFQTLSRLNVFHYDFLFLPHHEFGISEYEKAFFKHVSARFVILNQRDRTQGFLKELESLIDSTFLSLEELGATQFRHSKRGWSYQTFSNPSSEVISDRQVNLAY